MATTYNPWDVILVTGAHDHVAQHIVDQLLALPAARIRATFPSDVLAKHTYAFYEREKPDVLSRLEAVVVEDPCRAGAFDQVVQGEFCCVVRPTRLLMGLTGVTHIA